ncbi:MAG: undecaprenyl diphosphate synthase [Saprospiraceae bacterium]|jgi:undecaprenyl diphosphate synthase
MSSDEIIAKLIPQHIAIIMDGNGRWAKQRNKPRVFGHRQGVESVRTIVEHSARVGVSHLTIFAFSSENWNRPPTEVKLLLELLANVLGDDLARLHKNGIRLGILGDLSAFPKRLQNKIAKAIELTSANEGVNLNIAINYGGRWDIAQAARELADRVQKGELEVQDINESTLSAAMSTADIPDPDLLIRTGGEVRVSNFLLWQCAYAELYFTDTYWPDFDEPQLDKAIEWFAGRQRRYGKTGEQIIEGK